MRRLLFLLPLFLLAACGDSNARVDSEALRVVQAHLDARVEAMGLDTGDYRLTTDGLPGAGSHGGNGIAIALTPWDGDRDVLPLGLEYDYTFAMREGDTKIDIEIVHEPTDEELRTAVEEAIEEAGEEN